MNYSCALQLENIRLSRLLLNYQGRHLLLLSNHVLSSLSASPIYHKICLDQTPLLVPNDHSTTDYAFLQSDYVHLPFASDSMDVVILHHTLECNKNAKHILSEAWRVLAPNGHLILLGTNPASCWGIYRILACNTTLQSNFLHTITTVSQWLQHLGGQIVHIESFFFRPPLQSKLGTWLFGKLFWLEKISPWLFPYLGGIYLIIARNCRLRLRGVRLAWQFPPTLTNKALSL